MEHLAVTAIRGIIAVDLIGSSGRTTRKHTRGRSGNITTRHSDRRTGRNPGATHVRTFLRNRGRNSGASPHR